MSRINISAKRSGDKLTATEFNEVVDAVNDNDSRINAQGQQLTNFGTTINQQAQQMAQNAQSLRLLEEAHVPHEFYTQSQYDAKVQAGTVNEDALTFVYED